ncbi:hypothetical protein HHL19_08070 [Streptomyces sp. R302]|uniref:hypothetical protein n=1 Tax=unclassified Streptomyces TaxID=2593676 RepID=UPI00145CCA4D|nr:MULTISPECIES: hypothetical protein [unclassified Streptomyces]NML52785.1 hypothetical protein [Streptomyces sp. R301]NML78620.1 hypothetical protein [Streptomyces sp. R302]
MRSQSGHRKLRAAAVVCAVAAVAVPAPAAALAATAPGAPAPAAAAPTPDPFDGLTPAEIADRAVDATRSADSLRMTGQVVSEEQDLDVDFSVDDQGSCQGRIGVDEGDAELRRLDGVTYMKGDEAFWRISMTAQGVPENQIAPVIELVKGRWLKIAPGQAGSADLGEICDLDSLLDDLGKDRDGRSGLTRGPDREIDGTPVATLVEKESGETTTVSVAQEGKPYIRQVVRTGGDEPGSMTLSEFDRPVKVTAPPADETVDLSRLDPGTAA